MSSVKPAPATITGGDLLHRIKLHIWDTTAGPRATASDLSVTDLVAAAHETRRVFMTVTGHDTGTWAETQTYPAAIVDTALKAVTL